MLAATEAGARPLGSADRGLRRGGLVDKERAPANAAHRTGEGRGRARSDRPPPPRQPARSDAAPFRARLWTSVRRTFAGRRAPSRQMIPTFVRTGTPLRVAHQFRTPPPPTRPG